MLAFSADACARQVRQMSRMSHEPETLVRVPFDPEMGLVLVPVNLRGQSVWFAIDTGIDVSVVDTSLRQELGGRGFADKLDFLDKFGDTRLFTSFPASLGNIRLDGRGPFACHDLRMLSQVCGRRISGVLGMQFLSNYVLELDFAGEELRVVSGGAVVAQQAATQMVMGFNDIGIPFVKGRVGKHGSSHRFFIDTGMNISGTLRGDLFDAADQENAAETLFSTLAGEERGRKARISLLEFGERQYRGLVCGRARGSCLGVGFLKRHDVVTFDFPSARMYLGELLEPQAPDEADMSGLHLLRIDGKTVVHSVDKDSPADRAGVKAEDVIAKVDGKEAGEMEMWDIRRLLKSSDGKLIQMTVERGNEALEVSFLLKRVL